MRKLLTLALFASALLGAQPLPMSTPKAEGLSVPYDAATLNQFSTLFYQSIVD